MPPSFVQSAPPPSRPPYELTVAPPQVVSTTSKSNTVRPKNLFNNEDFHDPTFVSNDVTDDVYQDYYEDYEVTTLYTTVASTTVMPEVILGE